MFGRKLRHMLELRDMTQSDLVKATGLSKNLISGLASDTLTNTSTDTIKRISEALRVSPAYFLAEHAYTPLEALDLSDQLKTFILSLESMDYLILAKKLEEKQIPPEYIEKIVSAYEEVMKKDNK